MEDKTQNPFTAHFHDKIHLLIKSNNHNHLKEPNQYPFPAELNPKHESLGQDIEELKHFRNVIAAFLNYKHDSLKDVARMEKNFSTLKEDAKLLKYDYHNRIDKLKAAVSSNFGFILNIVEEYFYMFGLENVDDIENNIPQFLIPYKDMSKTRSTLKQFIRDWSAQGKVERDQCYQPIKEEFKKYYPHPTQAGRPVKVLFPGAGLGRLVYDFAVEGYASQGNEFSYFMLIASNFILNLIEEKEQFTVQPFIHNFSNLFEEKDPFESYLIPDVNPSSHMPSESDFSMVAGEFVEVYGKQEEEWDGVVTCFFLDTANNVIDYIKTIAKIVKKNGVWVNFGPLLYHYSEMEEEVSIELSWEEVKHVIEEVGFEIKHEEVRQAVYASEKRSMMNMVYSCIFFTAVKKEELIQQKELNKA